MNHPNVLFPDEPTLGVGRPDQDVHLAVHQGDEPTKECDCCSCYALHGRGRLLCNRVAIIDNGKIVALDSPKDLERHDWSRHHNFEAPIDSETFLGSLQAFDWIKSTHRSNGAIELMVPCESKIPEIIINASRNNVAIRSVGLHEPNLEDVFLKFTGKKIREAESANQGRMIARMWHRRK